MRGDEILVSTTPTLDSIEIEAYLGIVSAHVVAGTNIFSDIFASFSNIFGGRSQSYQNQLDAINQEAIDQLREKARKLGANAVVGLRIDHDELSGGGKSMFMVTAAGTAVKIDYKNEHHELSQSQVVELTSRELNEAQKCSEIIERCKNTPARNVLHRDTWRLVIDHRIAEIAEGILKGVGQVDYVSETEKVFIDNSTEYFSALPVNDAKNHLYKALENTESTPENKRTEEFVINIIEQLHFFDIERINILLDSEDIVVRTRAVAVAKSHKEIYRENDVSKLINLAYKIEEIFPKAKIYEETGKFSSKAKSYWNCVVCNDKRSSTDSYCLKCRTDQYGLKHASSVGMGKVTATVTVPTVANNLRLRARTIGEKVI